MRVRSRPPLSLAEPEPESFTPAPEPAPNREPVVESFPTPEPQAESDTESRIEGGFGRRARLVLEPETPAAEEPHPIETSAETPPSAAPEAEPSSQPEPSPGSDTVPAVAASPIAGKKAAPKGGLVNAYFIALISAVIWAAGVCAYAVGYGGGWGAFSFEPYRVAVLALLGIAPVPLLFAAAHLIRRSSALALETRRAYALSQSMVAPVAHAAGETSEIVKSLTVEIARAQDAAERARAELVRLHESLTLQTRELDAACALAAKSASETTEKLSRERERMSEAAEALDQKAVTVISAMDRQAHMVRDAAELAQAQLREAETALAARAADLAAAAGEAQDAARLASDDLARQTLRLETAGTSVAEQIRSVEEGLSQQRASLVQEAYQLRADQEAFAAQVESQRAQMVEVMSAARSAAGDLGEVSSKSGEALRELVEVAQRHFRELAEASEGERAALETHLREALEQFAATAAKVREEASESAGKAVAQLSAAAEEAKRASETAAETARARVDSLGEAAFEAGKRAEDAFEARMASAHRLIAESSALIETAGAKTAERIDADVKAMSAAMAQVEETLAQIDGRAARLPEEAKRRIDEIRAAVERGMETLATAAQRASEETEAADAAFQERIRRNYDLLAETVQMMGVVTGRAAAPALTTRRREEQLPAPAHEAHETETPLDLVEPADKAPADAKGFGLRGRLKLTRSEGDNEVRNLFETQAHNVHTESWSWRDVLGGLDAGAGAAARTGDDESLATRLVDEIKRLGVDPQALLPRNRVDEAAAAWAKGDQDGARQVVRRVAPAAVRRISRRVITDRVLRSLAEGFVTKFAARVRDAGVTEADAAALLSTEAGRSFLLIEAAIGDLG